VRGETWSLIHLFIITTVIAAGINLTLPLIPLYLRELGAGVFQISLVMTIAAFASTLLTYVGGMFCDRYGRKLSIFVGILLATVPPFMYTLSVSWMEMVHWVVLFNASMAFFSPARMSYIADRSRERSLGRIFGLMNIAWPIGGMLGPLIGGYLSDVYGWNEAFYFVTLISAISFIPAYLLYEAGREEYEGEEYETPGIGRDSIRRVLGVFFTLQLLIGIGIRATRPLLPLYLSDTFHVSRTELGLFFTLSFGVTTLITQVSASMLLERYGSKRAMLHSVLPIPVAFILLPWINDYRLLVIDYMVVNGFWSVSWPASMDLLMRSVPEGKRGFAAGVRQTGVRLGGAIGPLVGAFLWETLGPPFSFYASAAAFTLSLPLILLIKEPKLG